MKNTYFYSDFKNNGVVVQYCLACGFHHQYPLPSAEEIEKYYSDDKFYSTFSPSDWFEKERLEHKDNLWNASYDYQLSLFDLDKMSDDELYQQNAVRLIDVGAGAGWFVEYARRKMGYIFGIEPSQKARDYNHWWYIGKSCKARQVLNVRLSLVLEHLVDPEATIREWYKRMPVGGRIMIIVPNDFSSLQKRLKTNHFISKVHINYFTPDTLRALLVRNGFKIRHESATFPMELFQVLGYRYIGNDQRGRHCHRLRLRLEKIFGESIFSVYGLLYDWFGWGRELIFVGEKT